MFSIASSIFNFVGLMPSPGVKLISMGLFASSNSLLGAEDYRQVI